jgi:hypothetical protein
MVICPIARAVHCTGCFLFKICPAKTTLGDFGKENADEPIKKTDKKNGKGSEADERAGGNLPR